MDNRHREALRRIYQADRLWQEDGNEPEQFQLLHTGEGPDILHPRWDPSWAVPGEATIDDLGELEMLRVQPSFDKRRQFWLTVKGRREAAALAERAAKPTATGGRAPASEAVLRWLVDLDAKEPACFDIPSRLLDRAVTDGLIESDGRDQLARRILGLVEEGYLRGWVPDFEPATSEERLNRSQDLELTMKASQTAQASPHSMTVFAPIVNSQVAAGDIHNYATFIQLLDRAYEELEGLDDVDEADKQTALSLIDRLRGSATAAGGTVVTGAAAGLVTTVLARLLGLG